MSKDQPEVSASGLVDTKQAGSGVRRRRWSAAKRRELVAETLEPGQSVSVVARRHDVNANQLFKWRRQILSEDTVARAGLVPVTLAAPMMDSRSISMEIDLPGGTRVRITGGIDPAVVTAALGALSGGRR